MTTSLVVRAWDRTPVALSAEQAASLRRSGIVDVLVDEPTERWIVAAGSRVGVVLGHDWDLRVVPRLAIPRLMFMLAYSADPDGWRDIAAPFAAADDLVEAIASGFAWHAAHALAGGVLQGYVHREDRLPGVRGRLRFEAMVARSGGLPIPVDIAYDDFTPDIEENRLLLAAADVILRMRRVPSLARSRLMRLRALLDGVSLVTYRRPVRRPPATRLNARYSATLALAALILNASSVTEQRGETAATAFVFDMNEVFESFVHAALGASLARFGGELRREHVEYLDEAGSGLRLKPDLTWWRGSCQAVLDTKYKSLAERSQIPNADAYQMLAYCIALGLPRGVLLYAKDGPAAGVEHRVRRHGYVVDVRVLDLERNPDQLLAQIDALADELGSGGDRW